MGKKQPIRKTPKTVFIGVSDNEVIYKRDIYEDAQIEAIKLIENSQHDSILILEVKNAWVAELPPEPEVEFGPMDLSELMGKDDEE